MTLFAALVLALIQGLTEFLPVSSSGHLVIARAFLGEGGGLGLPVWLHGATLLSVLVYFRTDIIGFFRAHPAFVLISSALTAAIGFTGHAAFERAFDSSRMALACLAVTGVLLLTSRFLPGRSAGRP